jgi:hypothetical protein
LLEVKTVSLEDGSKMIVDGNLKLRLKQQSILIGMISGH